MVYEKHLQHFYETLGSGILPIPGRLFKFKEKLAAHSGSATIQTNNIRNPSIFSFSSSMTEAVQTASELVMTENKTRGSYQHTTKAHTKSV